MILILFYMENLKTFILESIENTNIIPNEDESEYNKKTIGKGKLFEGARSRLVKKGIISKEESEILKELIDYRNDIGHRIYMLTFDVGAYSSLGIKPRYDYTAAKKARILRRKIMNEMGKHFILTLSFDSLAFESAENSYTKEIERLKKKINKGIEALNIEATEINRQINSIPKSVIDKLQPGHPKNHKGNGTLSPQGFECVFTLFELQVRPLTVSYIMRCSYRTAISWYKKWKESKKHDSLVGVK
ncbi:hypothetical protein F3J40_13260 [Pantoea sp. Acro-835]|uniref:Uncharacterized protein n=2 Tax=Candidatus Pantoea multigeneris TaxID=2608357 RepID=A0ABX0REJ1_9GAMM|nr:hypothetical protein [Pantoea multigeneris]